MRLPRPNAFLPAAALWLLAAGVCSPLAAQDGPASALTPANEASAAAEAPATPPGAFVFDTSKALQLPSSPTAVERPAAIDPHTKQIQAWNPAGISDFKFTDQLGREVTKETLLGKPWAICFVFTHCRGPCPAVTKAMSELQARVKNKDVRLVTLTVDPARDTVEVLRKYSEQWGADPDRWLFLTGDQRDIYTMIGRDFLMRVQEVFGKDREPGYEFIHTTNVMLVDQKGVVRGKYNATDPAQLASLRRHLVALADGDEKVLAEDAAKEAEADRAFEAAVAKAEAENALPEWVARLPRLNAMLNGLATVLLVVGYILIRNKQVVWHQRAMLSAFSTSVAFLFFYLLYHWGLHHYTGSSGKPFQGQGPIRAVYFAILITHVFLAAAVPVLALITITRAVRQQWVKHRQIAIITFPIWLYVSVTGVVIYYMLYHMPVS